MRGREPGTPGTEPVHQPTGIEHPLASQEARQDVTHDRCWLHPCEAFNVGYILAKKCVAMSLDHANESP